MSGFYIGVDGKARKVKGAYIGVDGVARKIKKGYIGDENGVARLCWTAFEADPVFENNTWENIALACQLDAVPDSWTVGDQKTMTIGDWDYTIDIIGKNHDDYADGSGKAPLTFQLHDLYESECCMNWKTTNEGGWTESDIRKTYLPEIMLSMPTDVQTNIREVTKITTAGGGSTNLVTTSDKLFLLSEMEICGTTAVSQVAEGTQYEYYANGASVRKYIDGIERWYWIRSPYPLSDIAFGVMVNDSASTLNSQYESLISFAFCF